MTTNFSHIEDVDPNIAEMNANAINNKDDLT